MAEEITEEQRVAEQDFVMPKPGVGDAIVFYPKGITTESRATVAFVRGVGARCLQVVGLGHVGYEGVRHVSDPAAARSREIRESGLWDFPASTRALQADIASLREQIAQNGDASGTASEIKELRSLVEGLSERVVEIQPTQKSASKKSTSKSE